MPGYSAFTVNTRTSTSQTTFDKRLLTVMPDGATTINGVLQTGNKCTIKGASEGDTATLYLSTPYASDSASKCALIAQGLGSYSKSKLHIC